MHGFGVVALRVASRNDYTIAAAETLARSIVHVRIRAGGTSRAPRSPPREISTLARALVRPYRAIAASSLADRNRSAAADSATALSTPPTHRVPQVAPFFAHHLQLRNIWFRLLRERRPPRASHRDVGGLESKRHPRESRSIPGASASTIFSPSTTSRNGGPLAGRAWSPPNAFGMRR